MKFYFDLTKIFQSKISCVTCKPIVFPGINTNKIKSPF